MFYVTTNRHFIIPLRRRRITWITPCKRSAARGQVTVHYPSNSVGVQPTTGLYGGEHCVPRALHGVIHVKVLRTSYTFVFFKNKPYFCAYF